MRKWLERVSRFIRRVGGLLRWAVIGVVYLSALVVASATTARFFLVIRVFLVFGAALLALGLCAWVARIWLTFRRRNPTLPKLRLDDLPPAKSVAVVFVHGVGTRTVQGAHAADFERHAREALARVTPKVEVSGSPASPLRIGDIAIGVYEAYWADLLADEEDIRGGFSVLKIASLAWFPWLNDSPRRSARTTFATLGLVAGGCLFSVTAYSAAGFLWVFRKLGAARRDLDDIAGDVFNYVDSVGGVFVDSHRREVASRIVERVHEALAAAVADGYEEIHLVAHSLGTVIAYHALTGRVQPLRQLTPTQIIGLERIRYLYTIGSPLEKFRWFWPSIMVEDGLSSSRKSAPDFDRDNGIEWVNFFDRLDPIAGKLTHFERWGVTNYATMFGGGYVMSHVRYMKNPDFMTQVLSGALRRPLRLRSSWWTRFRRSMTSLSMNLALVVGPVLAAAFAVVLALAATLTAAGVVALLAQAKSNETPAGAPDPHMRGLEVAVLTVVFTGMVLGLLVYTSRGAAKKSHAQHWRRNSSGCE